MTDERNHSALDLDAEEREALRAIGWRQPAGKESCPDSSVLLAAEEGVLDEETASRVRTHVAGCATCQLLVKDFAAVFAEPPDEGAVSRIRAKIPAEVPARRSYSYVWWGVGLAAAAGIAWFLVVPRVAPLPAPDTQVARATPPPIPSVFVVGRPVIPAGDVDLAVRGDASTRVSLEDQISAALDKADNGDVAAAMLDLQGVADKHKTSRIAALALGAVQLRAGQNAEATTTLERARSFKGDAATADESAWFLSIALVRTGNAERARGILEEICRQSGGRGPAACAGVTEIDRKKSPR